jgi:predicted amidophosphoribosyltransferase
MTMAQQKFARCEGCKALVAKGKRFCKRCAIEVAKRWNLDYFEPEKDNATEDAIARYERENRIKAWCAIAIIMIVGVMAIVAIVGGSR